MFKVIGMVVLPALVYALIGDIFLGGEDPIRFAMRQFWEPSADEVTITPVEFTATEFKTEYESPLRGKLQVLVEREDGKIELYVSRFVVSDFGAGDAPAGSPVKSIALKSADPIAFEAMLNRFLDQNKDSSKVTAYRIDAVPIPQARLFRVLSEFGEADASPNFFAPIFHILLSREEKCVR